MADKTTAHPRQGILARGLFAILLLLFTILVVNGLLDFVNLERYDKYFAPKSSYPIFIPGEGEKAAYYVTNPHFQASLNDQAFLKGKKPGVTRIFVVGGSAAYGWPYTEAYGFSGFLRRTLDRFAPGKFEVINAAGMSFGSHRVLDVLRDVVLLEPDLVIINSGNNEYVEKNVLPALEKGNGTWERISTVVDDTNLYRALRLALFKATPGLFAHKGYQDLTELRADGMVHRGEIGRTGVVDQEVLGNYQHNIQAMKDLLRAAGVKTIITTVPNDVVGYRPDTLPLKFASSDDAARWQNLEEKYWELFAQLGAMDPARFPSAYNQLREIHAQQIALQPSHAGVYFDLGQALYGMGLFAEAYQEFVKARDLDVWPVRALSSFNAFLRQQADEGHGIFLADLDEAIADEIRRGHSSGIYLDYCHYTEAGNKFVATFLLQILDTIFDSKLPLPEMSQAIFHDDWVKRQQDPKVMMMESYAIALTLQHNGYLDEAEKAFLRALELSPFKNGTIISGIYDNLSAIAFNKGDEKKAREMIFKALEVYSGHIPTLVLAGNLYLNDGDPDKAEELFRQALAKNAYSPGAVQGLAQVALHRRRPAEAVALFNEALGMGRDNILLRKELGRAYLALGDSNNAVQALEAALSFDHEDQETATMLAEARGKQ